MQMADLAKYSKNGFHLDEYQQHRGSKTSTTGVIVATYERAGKVKTGSFVLEAPTEAELARRKRLKEGK